MEQYNDIYNRNKKLDDIFMNKYMDTESSYYEKNCLELIVEIGEINFISIGDGNTIKNSNIGADQQWV